MKFLEKQSNKTQEFPFHKLPQPQTQRSVAHKNRNRFSPDYITTGVGQALFCLQSDEDSSGQQYNLEFIAKRKRLDGSRCFEVGSSKQQQCRGVGRGVWRRNLSQQGQTFWEWSWLFNGTRGPPTIWHPQNFVQTEGSVIFPCQEKAMVKIWMHCGETMTSWHVWYSTLKTQEHTYLPLNWMQPLVSQVWIRGLEKRRNESFCETKQQEAEFVGSFGTKSEWFQLKQSNWRFGHEGQVLRCRRARRGITSMGGGGRAKVSSSLNHWRSNTTSRLFQRQKSNNLWMRNWVGCGRDAGLVYTKEQFMCHLQMQIPIHEWQSSVTTKDLQQRKLIATVPNCIKLTPCDVPILAAQWESICSVRTCSRKKRSQTTPPPPHAKESKCDFALG